MPQLPMFAAAKCHNLAILRYNCCMKSSTRNLLGSCAQQRLNQSRCVTGAFMSMTKPTELAYIFINARETDQTNVIFKIVILLNETIPIVSVVI